MSCIVDETCIALVHVMKNKYLQVDNNVIIIIILNISAFILGNQAEGHNIQNGWVLSILRREHLISWRGTGWGLWNWARDHLSVLHGEHLISWRGTGWGLWNGARDQMIIIYQR